MPSWILFVALFALWPLVRRYMVARTLTGLTYIYRHHTIVDPAELPPHLARLMREKVEDLERRGFQVAACFRNEVGAMPGEYQWIQVLLEPSLGCWAFLDMAEDVSRIGTVELSYMTFFSREQVFLTSSRPAGIQGDPAGMERVATSFDQLWEIHRSRVEETCRTSSRKPVIFSPDELAEVLAGFVNRHIDFLISGKRLKQGRQSGTWRMTWPEAWKYACVALRAAKVAEKEAAVQPGAALPPPIPEAPERTDAALEHEVDMFLSFRKILGRSKGSGLEKLILLVASMGIFLFWLGFNLSFQSIVILFLVLLVHESGHLFGMWLFGYRNLQMLFLPFFGALAIGAREQAKPWQELIVLLLGPIPGLTAGIVLFLTMPSMEPWLHETAMILLLLNGFNLLPIYPMDGGQLVRLAFFTRFPRVGAGFLAVSGVLLGLVGWHFNLWVLIVVGVMMLMGIKKNFAGAAIVNAVRRVIPDSPTAQERDVAREVLRRVESPTFSLRYRDATQPFTALRTPVAGFGTIAVVALLYLSLPVAAWMLGAISLL